MAHLNRTEDARAALIESERLEPGYAEKWAYNRQYRSQANTDHLLEGLRKAGLLE